MSNPLPPPGFQPPNYPYAPQKRPVSCWAVGGIGCVVIFVLGAILMFVAFYKFVQSPTGRDLMKGANDVAKTTVAGSACVEPMTQIQKAILRYHEHEGKYPDNLTQLTAKYLPPGITLHCGVDKSDDPSHVTYQYFKPTATTPASSVLLRYSWSVTITVYGQSQTQVTLGGTVSSYQTSSVSGTPSTHSPPISP